MKQYDINHTTEARLAFEKRYPEFAPTAFFEKVVHNSDVFPIGNKQAWILEDALGNKWLQSYNTLVSVKWSDGTFERFGYYSRTTSCHQTLFERNA